MNSTEHTGSPLAVRQEWLDLRGEEILEPELPIVDPHHHLWRRPGWPYLVEDLLRDVQSGHNVLATVYIQCRAMYREHGPEHLRPVGETEFAAAAAALSENGKHGKTRACAAIVGHADLRLGAAVDEVLHAHLDAGGGRFRGVRHSNAWDADPVIANPELGATPGLLGDPHFRAGFARLAPLDLSFDAWLYHPQIDELRILAQAFPDTRIVLNHVGGPVGIGRYAGLRDEVFTQWNKDIARLARCPNVSVKLGGLGMRISGAGFHERPLPPSSQELAESWHPYIDACIAHFGPQRCMFESNFPVDKASTSYAVLWNAFKRLASSHTHDEKTALMSRTAARFYRMEPGSDSSGSNSSDSNPSRSALSRSNPSGANPSDPNRANSNPSGAHRRQNASSAS